MQDVTPWPESFDVSQPVARVLVDGQEVAVESVTVSSELDSAMPERVAAGGGGVVAATGDASILRADDVAEAGFNPWGDAQQFVSASEVVVEAGYRDPDAGGVGCARQVTGQVESLDGSATANHVGLEFVDYTPLLDRDITIEPLLEVYPQPEAFVPIRGAGLVPMYVTDRVLRHCGFYATPPVLDGALFSAPLMGSAVAERGELVEAWSITDDTQAVEFRTTPWGMGLGDGVTKYEPDLTASSGRLTSTLHVSFHRSDRVQPTTRDSRIQLWWGNIEQAITIRIFGEGHLGVVYERNGTSTRAATLSAANVAASDKFTVLIEPSGEAVIYASNESTASGSAALPPLMTSEAMRQVEVRVPPLSPGVGGVQVAFSDTRLESFEPTAHLDPPAHLESLQAFPFQHEVNCLNLLKEHAEAELAAMWIDEFGHFQWRNRHNLRESPPVGTLTSKDNLMDLPWNVPVKSVYSRVEIEHDVPTVTLRRWPSITVSDSRGSTLADGETEDRFFEPPANQDWHLVDTPVWMGGTINYWQFVRGRHSYRGGVIVDDDNEERLAYSNRLHQTWSQINPQRWLLHSEARGLTYEEYIEQSLRDRPDLYGRFATENLPLIRVKGLVEWEQDKTVGAARGPSLAPVYVHPVGPWVQDSAELRSLANWLAELLTIPDVILRDIPIVPDPRIQLGDVFWLEDQTAYDVRLRVVVMGKTLRLQSTNTGHEMTQQITCRVLEVERLGVRYDELEAAWQGQDYFALESAWSGQDYETLAANPLDRS